YAKGGILGKVNEFVGKAKSKLADGFMSFATPALNGLTDGLKDRFGKGTLPNVPYHLMSSVIIPKMLSFLQERKTRRSVGERVPQQMSLALLRSPLASTQKVAETTPT